MAASAQYWAQGDPSVGATGLAADAPPPDNGKALKTRGGGESTSDATKVAPPGDESHVDENRPQASGSISAAS